MDKFKNVALSLAVIAGVTGLVFGATQATWTSQADNTDNQFVAGEVQIEFTGEGNTRRGDGVATEPFFSVGAGDPDYPAMVPGDSETAYIAVANNGTTDITFELEQVNRSFDGTPGLDRVLLLEVEQIGNVGLLTGTFQSWISDNDYTLWTPGNTGTTTWIDFSDGNTLRDWHEGNLVNPMGSSHPMAPGEVAVYRVEVMLDENAGNEYQGNGFTVDVLATATQLTTED